MKEFITSDWHLGHTNICGSDGFVPTRTVFDSTEVMDNHIISAVNSVVTNDDVLYHLGDISLHRKPKQIFDLLSSMKGQIILFKGNHDNSKLLKYIKNNNYTLPNGKPKFVIHEVGITIKRNGIVYYLTHYPMGLGEYRRNLRSICGHIHQLEAREANVINVGIDSPELPKGHPFAVPIELDTAMELVNAKWDSWYAGVKRLVED